MRVRDSKMLETHLAHIIAAAAADGDDAARPRTLDFVGPEAVIIVIAGVTGVTCKLICLSICVPRKIAGMLWEEEEGQDEEEEEEEGQEEEEDEEDEQVVTEQVGFRL